MFYWALGIIPFKDGFYSSTNKQVGGQTVGPETHPDREAIMATLSCGMVGPMDGIYLINKTRIMATCDADGYVLRPDRPVTTTDACFALGNPTCHIGHTYSDIDGLGRVHYVFNSDENKTFAPEQAYLNASSNFAVYNWYTGEILTLAAATASFNTGYEGTTYAIVSPIVNGMVFIGETNKYTVASSKRFPKVTPTTNGFDVSVVGVKDETVTVCAAKVSSQSKICKMVNFEQAGTQSVNLE